MDGVLIAGIAIIGFPLLVLIFIYNGHVNRRNAVDYAFASIDVQLKKRWDLIPNLVSTVKGYAQHEKELLEQPPYHPMTAPPNTSLKKQIPSSRRNPSMKRS